MTDRELVAGIRGGTVDYEVLVKQYSGAVNTWALRLLRNRADAEEVCQCVFIRAWLRLGRYDPDRAHLSTWLRQLCQHAAASSLRHKRLEPVSLDALPLAQEPGCTGKAEELAAESERQRLMRMVSELPEAERETLLDRYQRGMTWPATGRAVGRCERQTRYYAARALTTLRRRLRT